MKNGFPNAFFTRSNIHARESNKVVSSCWGLLGLNWMIFYANVAVKHSFEFVMLDGGGSDWGLGEGLRVIGEIISWKNLKNFIDELKKLCKVMNPKSSFMFFSMKASQWNLPKWTVSKQSMFLAIQDDPSILAICSSSSMPQLDWLLSKFWVVNMEKFQCIS